VIMRILSYALPQRAPHFSDGTAVIYRSCPPLYGEGEAR
jgi:hypothetical protein